VAVYRTLHGPAGIAGGTTNAELRIIDHQPPGLRPVAGWWLEGRHTA